MSLILWHIMAFGCGSMYYLKNVDKVQIMLFVFVYIMVLCDVTSISWTMNNENTLIVQYQTTLRLNHLKLYSINVKH